MISRIGIRHLKITTAGLFLLAESAALPSNAEARVDESLIRAIVTDIGSGINQARLSSVPSSGAYPGLTIKFAAARPEKAADVETAAKVEATTIRVMADMQRRYADRFRFVSDAAREALVKEIASGIANEENRVRFLEDLEASAKPDILIRSLLYEKNGKPRLIYQAVGVATAEILATSRPVPLDAEAPMFLLAGTDAPLPPSLDRLEDPKRPVHGGRPPSGSDGTFRPIALEAERLLVARGYDPGRIDGYIDSDLRRALSHYQANSALAINGRMTWETVENLRRDRRGIR